jgi:hypothetical protein
MSARLRSDIWVSAYLRRCAVMGAVAVLRRRGAAEAGAIYIKLDWLDGRSSLFAPAPPDSDVEDDTERRFECVLQETDAASVEARMIREIRFDPDLWFVEVEDRQGRVFLDRKTGLLSGV